MARASIATAVSLDQWAALWGIHPALFNGVMGSGLIKGDRTSRPVLYQHDWQNHDALGRESIAAAIQEAESRIAAELGWKAQPTAESDTLYRVTLVESSEAFIEQRITELLTPLHWGHVQNGGVITETLVEANVPVTYGEADDSNNRRSWSATLSTTLTDTSELAVYFSDNDRLTDRDETWRIRPVRLSISGGILTITGQRWQMVKPELWETLNPGLVEGLSPVNDDNFVFSVDVYRRRVVNTSSHVTFYWTDGTTQTGFLDVYGKWHVKLQPGTYADSEWTASALTYTDPAKLRKVTVNYVAGQPTDAFGNVSTELARHIDRFSVGFLPKDMGSVVPAEMNYKYWREVLTADGNLRFYDYDPTLLENPLGKWRGAVEAWQYITRQNRSDYV